MVETFVEVMVDAEVESGTGWKREPAVKLTHVVHTLCPASVLYCTETPSPGSTVYRERVGGERVTYAPVGAWTLPRMADHYPV